MADAAKEFGISCPAGSKFYVCDKAKTQFVGCCATDPCNSNGVCASVKPASYDESKTIPAQSCSSGKWYTCPKLQTPFMGCCSKDPCSKGCEANDVKPAVLSKDKKNAEPFIDDAKVTTTSKPTTTTKAPETKTTTSSKTTSSKTTSTTTSESTTSTTESTSSTTTAEISTVTEFVDADRATGTSASPTGSALPSVGAGAAPGNLSTAAKAGIGIGVSLIAIIMIACLAHWFMKRFRKKKEEAYQPFPFEDDYRFRDAKPAVSSSPTPPPPQPSPSTTAGGPHPSHINPSDPAIQSPEAAYTAPTRSMSSLDYAAAAAVPPTRDSHYTMHTQRSSTFSTPSYGQQGMGMGMQPMSGTPPYAMAAMHGQPYMYGMPGQPMHPMAGHPHPYPHPGMSPAGQLPMHMQQGMQQGMPPGMNGWGYPMMGPQYPSPGSPSPLGQPYGGQYQAYHPGVALAGTSFTDSYRSSSPGVGGINMAVNQSHVAVELEDTATWHGNQQRQQQEKEQQTQISTPDGHTALKTSPTQTQTQIQTHADVKPISEKMPTPGPDTTIQAFEMEAPLESAKLAKQTPGLPSQTTARQPESKASETKPQGAAQPQEAQLREAQPPQAKQQEAQQEAPPPPPPPKDTPPMKSTELPQLQLNFTPSAPISLY